MKLKTNCLQVKNEIDSYINQECASNAILLDGEWGCGKTYFIKEAFIKRTDYKDTHIFVYISCYGLMSEDELKEKMLDSLLKISNVGKLLGGIKKTVSIIKDYNNINTTFFTIDTIIDKLSKKVVLIFDDIERCEMPINQLLGSINYYVEHKGIFTIIIANQKEIFNIQLSNNRELKYLAAKDIKISKKEKEIDPFIQGFNSDIKDEKNDTNDICALNNKVEELFSSNNYYEKIKEKLVGKELLFIPDISSIFDSIIDSQINNVITEKVLKDEKESIINVFACLNNYNIRTLKNSIIVFKSIYLRFHELLKNKEQPKEFYSEYLKYICYACIHYKKGSLLNSWNNEEEFSHIYIPSVGYIYSFKFIDSYIKDGYISGDYLQKIYDLFMKKIEEDSNADTSWRALRYYWEMNDSEIMKEIHVVLKKIEDGSLPITCYKEVLYYVYKIKSLGLAVEEYNTIKGKMQYMIDNAETPISSGNYKIRFEDKLDERDFIEEFKPIKNAMEEKRKLSEYKELNDLIKYKNGWASELMKYIDKNDPMNKKGFFKYLNIAELINTISISMTKDISDFRRMVYSLYNYANINEFYSDDYDNIKLTINKLDDLLNDKANEYDKTKFFNIKWLHDILSNILVRLSDSNNNST